MGRWAGTSVEEQIHKGRAIQSYDILSHVDAIESLAEGISGEGAVVQTVEECGEVAREEKVTFQIKPLDDVVLQFKGDGKLPTAFDAPVSAEGIARIVPERVGGVEVFTLHRADLFQVVCCEREGRQITAKLFADEAFEGLDVDREVVFEHRNVLAHTLHALRHQFLLARCDAPHHVLPVRVEEHCAVHNVASR